MKHDFTEFLPYIVATLLVVSSVVIVERGSFENKTGNIKATPAPVSSVLPAVNPTPSPTPFTTTPPELLELTAPTPTPVPVVTTKPSIGRPRIGDDD